MKLNNSLLFALSLLLCGAASCDDSTVENDNPITIDPVESSFQFDQDGVPYLSASPTPSTEMQQMLKDEFVGYGWKCMCTNEINDNGTVCSQPFYETIYGVGPISYYIESDSVLYSYYHSDVNNQDGYLSDRYTLDVETATLSNYSKPFGRDGGDIYFRICSVFTIDGRCYLLCVEPLATTFNEVGLPHIRWGVSQYLRMNSTELAQMQSQYDTYFGIKID